MALGSATLSHGDAACTGGLIVPGNLQMPHHRCRVTPWEAAAESVDGNRPLRKKLPLPHCYLHAQLDANVIFRRLVKATQSNAMESLSSTLRGLSPVFSPVK